MKFEGPFVRFSTLHNNNMRDMKKVKTINAKDGKETEVLVKRLGTITAMYKMKIGPDMSKVMAATLNGFQTRSR